MYGRYNIRQNKIKNIIIQTIIIRCVMQRVGIIYILGRLLYIVVKRVKKENQERVVMNIGKTCTAHC